MPRLHARTTLQEPRRALLAEKDGRELWALVTPGGRVVALEATAQLRYAVQSAGADVSRDAGGYRRISPVSADALDLTIEG